MPIYKQNKKKDGLQCYKIVVSYTQNGEHKQISRLVYGLTEAREAEAELLAQTKAPQSSRMTVSDLIQRFLFVRKSEIKETTIKYYESVLTSCIAPQLGGIRLDRLTVQTLETWKSDLSQSGYAVGTQKAAHNVLNAMLNYAVKVDILDRNPLKKIKPPKNISAPKEKLHYYTAEQLREYLSAALFQAQQTRDFRFYVFAAIAIYTGMRKGEINALKWNDISGDVIHVQRTVEQHVHGKTVESSPKTAASVRDIQIPDALLTVLLEQRSRQESSPAFSEDFRICGGQKIVNDNTLKARHFAAIEAAGLPQITIHDLRHSHASLLINEGISIQEIARRLGHSEVETTWKVYAHLYPREEERAVKILNQSRIIQESFKNISSP